jgi:hypothetical protein
MLQAALAAMRNGRFDTARGEAQREGMLSTTAADPIALALSPAGVQRRLEACRPSQPVRVGLLLNPRAGRAKHGRMRSQLHALLGDSQACAETWDLASVRRALAHLLCAHQANVLAIAGGDGTVHHAVNALIDLTRETELATGHAVPLPRLLILNGGTLNIVGRTCAIHGPPQEILAKFQKFFGGGPLSRVPARRVPLLEVSWWQGQVPVAPRYGFVFGSEVAYHAIELYERFGAGYGGLTRFLFELSRGIAWGSELWSREGWKLGPFTSGMNVDGVAYPSYTGVAASTVDLTLAVGAAAAVRRKLYQPGFSARVVRDLDPRSILQLLPAMMADRPTRGLDDFPTAARLELFGPYTLDGELFHEPPQAPHRLPLTVSISSQRLHAVPGEWTTEEW